MDTKRLFATLDELLVIHGFDAIDSALNGVQVGCEKQSVELVITAVDASLETIRRATERGADCLLVHHGLFWGGMRAITGNHRSRIKELLACDCALYAAHIPLDVHPLLGNNIAIAEQLQLTDIAPFGAYHGVDIGYRGTLAAPQSIEEIRHTLLRSDSAEPLGVLPFGLDRCRHIGIVSGGGNFALQEAIANGIDLLITGDARYESYYEAQENAINVLFAGHYNTETGGVQRMARHLTEQIGVPAEFIDLPTGL